MSPVELVRRWRSAGRGEALLVVGARQLAGAWKEAGHWHAAPAVPLGAANDMAALTLALTTLGNMLHEAGRPARIRVLLADAWLGQAALPWSGSDQHGQAALAYARFQLAASGTAVEDGDVIRLDDDAPAGQPRLAVAYPAAIMAALAHLSRKLGAPLATVLPLSVAAWRRLPAARAAGVLGLMDQGMVSLAHGTGRVQEVTVRGTDVLEPAGASAELLRHWQRLRLRTPHLDRVATLPVFDLWQAPAPGCAALAPQALTGGAPWPALALACTSRATCALDAVHGAAPLAGWRLVLGATALAATAALLGQVALAQRQLNALVPMLSERNASTTAAVAPVGWRPDEIDRIGAVNGAVRMLNLPIGPLLAALQPPLDIGVGVLGVEVLGPAGADGSSRGGVRIEAEARSGAEMARYVAFVGAQRPFLGAFLTRHDIVEDGAGRNYRFTLEAEWAD